MAGAMGFENALGAVLPLPMLHSICALATALRHGCRLKDQAMRSWRYCCLAGVADDYSSDLLLQEVIPLRVAR